MLIDSDMKVAEIILKNPYFLLMLDHFGIQLEVHEKSVKQICQEYRIDTELFVTFANLFNGQETVASTDLQPQTIPQIIHYLQRCHRYYLEEKIPEIESFLQQLNAEGDAKKISLAEQFFQEYVAEVRIHLQYENDLVFPYVLNLYQQVMHSPIIDRGELTIRDYQDRHHDIEEKLTDLKNLLIKYLPVTESTPILRNLLFTLFEFESDLNIHTLIEDCILIPLVERLERSGKS